MPQTIRLVSRLVPAVLALLVAVPETGFADAPEPLEWPQPVYQIRMEAELDPETGRIEAAQHLRWHNTSSVAIQELQFHLYLNAFANNRTTFMGGSGGKMRGDVFPDGEWGWIEVSSIVTAEGTDLKPSETFLAPDDGNPNDRTVVSYQLEEPLPPDEWIEIDLAFTCQLPGIFARTGIHGDYFVAGQWFPKIGVFEDVGVRGRAEAGWNCHQYHPTSEFYADFGSYDVTLTLPIRYQGKIGATGRLVDEWTDADKVSVRFVQDGVHDFVWAGDPRFEVIRETFDPDRDVGAELTARVADLLGVPQQQLALQPVEITLLLQPEHHSQAGRYINAAKAGLRSLGLRLGAYPYPTLTLLDPARGAAGSGGMEYPTFIALATHPALDLPILRGLPEAEIVTIHEFAHQYFYGMVASNEFEESWIDEGMTSYYEMVTLEDENMPLVTGPGLELSAEESNRIGITMGGFKDPIVRPSWQFTSSHSYYFNSYSRPAATLRHLENIVGTGAFHRGMRRFFTSWRWRHPSTDDFVSLFQEEVGRDLEWFFHQALHTTRVLDYSVARASCRRIPAEEGYFVRDAERILVEPDSDDDEQRYRSRVLIQRTGGFEHPIEVELVFDDGRRERLQWDGSGDVMQWERNDTCCLASVEIDPDHQLILESDRLNNSRRLEPAATGSTKVLIQMLFFLQNLLEITSVLG